MTERILAFALLLWPLAALADAGYFCSFETSPMDCGFKEQAKVPGRASLVDIARDGSKAVRLYTEPGDNDVGGSGTSPRARGGVMPPFPQPGGRGQATSKIFVKPGARGCRGAGGPSVAFRSGDP